MFKLDDTHHRVGCQFWREDPFKGCGKGVCLDIQHVQSESKNALDKEGLGAYPSIVILPGVQPLSIAVVGTGLLALVAIGVACGGTAAPTPTPDSRIDQVLEQLSELGDRLTELESRIAAAPTPISTLKTMEGEETMDMEMEEDIQEVSIIENYAANRFFPPNIVVLKDITVRLYLTRLYREHVNRFTIQPFFQSLDVILPGEIGIIEFLPDQTGEFKIRNVGHDFEATLVVVETVEEKNRYIAERGRQMYALIHSVDEFRIFPDRLEVQAGIPVTIHNIGIIGGHKVSFKPFHEPEDLNVRPREITSISFTPETPGEFEIRHEIHGFTGTLVVGANE